MKYGQIIQGEFIFRHNRFSAEVLIDGNREFVHVKNTGRCRELLLPGTPVLLDKSPNPNRKTAYDLVAVYKGDTLINIDSQAPNKAFGEFLKSGRFLPALKMIKAEASYGNSRLDFYFENARDRIFAEVKGVTLENNRVAMFPDAPTERGVRHVEELIKAKEEGYEAYIVFIIQMSGIRYFTPNDETHPAFGNALRMAESKGVHVIALDCSVAESSMEIRERVEVVL